MTTYRYTCRYVGEQENLTLWSFINRDVEKKQALEPWAAFKAELAPEPERILLKPWAQIKAEVKMAQQKTKQVEQVTGPPLAKEVKQPTGAIQANMTAEERKSIYMKHKLKLAAMEQKNQQERAVREEEKRKKESRDTRRSSR